MPVLPPAQLRGHIGETLQLAQRLSQLCCVVVRINDRIAPAVIDDQARRELVVAEATAALPIHSFGNAAFVCASDYLLQARNNMRMTVLAQFDHDPATAHFVGDSARGS